jgi:oligopeptide/dipeptide ABC transporter ATP-binding protein
MGVSVIDGATAGIRGHRPVINLLQVRDLTVRYSHQGHVFNAVERVSFDIRPGEIVGVLGESGCGKTTVGLSLLRLLPDAAHVTGGRILLRGRDLGTLSESQLREVRGAEVAIIYQDSNVLNPVIRVGKQVSAVMRAHSGCTASRAREEVEVLFSAIGLRDFDRLYDSYPHQLSGGQRQRIAIAQALICKPSLVIADEPTASVDPTTACEIIVFMKQMNQLYGTSFLFISHDPATLAAIASRLVVMYAGEIIENGPLRDVYSRPLHPYTEALLQCAPQRIDSRSYGQNKTRMPFIPGRAPDPMEIMPGCSFSNRCNYRMETCDLRKPESIQLFSGRSVRCFKHEVG